MYQVTLQFEDDIKTQVTCKQITHHEPLVLRLMDIDDKEVFHRLDLVKSMQIKVKNKNEVHCLLDFDDLTLLNAHLTSDYVEIGFESNYYLCDYFTYKMFQYIHMVASSDNRAWLTLSDEEQSYWLYACRNFSRKPKAFNLNVVLDGQLITSKHSFLCEFGEQVIGVGGYLGSNLSALDDCLSTRFYEGFDSRELEVTWKDFNKHDFEQKEVIVEILEDNIKKLLILD